MTLDRPHFLQLDVTAHQAPASDRWDAEGVRDAQSN
jgi:hypothetical protein